MIALYFQLDTSQVRGLRAVFRASLRRGVEAVTKKGVGFVRDELPDRSGRARDGVSYDMSPGDSRLLRGEVTLSAVRPASAAGVGELHLPGGGVRPVKIGATREYDYGEALLKGTGLYGVRGALIRPRTARALRIEVATVEAGEAYVSYQGRLFVYRKFSKGQRPDRFDERAARKLEEVAAGLLDLALAPLSN